MSMLDFEAVSEHISRLEVSWHVYGVIPIPVAMWLVRIGDRWTLVDCGPPETAERVVAAVARATDGHGPQSILLTHAHVDHAGGLAALRLAWNPAILCHRDEVPFVTGEADHAHIEPRGAGFWVGRFILPRATLGMPVARDLERGQAAEGMAVIHLPGHSPGQIGFLHPEDRAMICGDAVMNLGRRLSGPYVFATPDPAAAKASLRRLGELDFEYLLPSHGSPITRGGREAMLRFLGQVPQEPSQAPW